MVFFFFGLAKPYWVLFRVSDFTVSPVFLAEDMTFGLQNIKCQIEDNPCFTLKKNKTKKS